MHVANEAIKWPIINDAKAIFFFFFFFKYIINLAITNRNLYLSPVRVPFFPSTQWPKDPGPNSYGSVDWAWFTTAKELFKNQVMHKASFLQYK